MRYAKTRQTRLALSTTVAGTDLPLYVMVIEAPQYWEEPGTSPNCYGGTASQKNRTKQTKNGEAYSRIQRDDLGIRERENKSLMTHALHWSLT